MELDATRIAKGLWVGAAPPPGRYGKYFDVIVLTAQEYQPAAESFPGVRVRHFPYDDRDPPQEEDVLTAWDAAEAVARDMQRGRRVLVTCRMGRNRSALVAALALHVLGMTGGEACRLVRGRRHDRLGIQALDNDAFRELLTALR